MGTATDCQGPEPVVDGAVLRNKAVSQQEAGHPNSKSELKEEIQYHLGAMRSLITLAKQQEAVDDISDDEIFALQPKLQEHCKMATEVWAELHDRLLELGGRNMNKDEGADLARLRCELEALRKDRAQVYFRCRLRHSARLAIQNPEMAVQDFKGPEISKKWSFPGSRYLRFPRKHAAAF
jgi:hypothetical protein